ncbi:DUF6400 family protein [Kitasatospora sp. NPDC057015]|uniref:DUF6400 family protein n=1 Tax=Kitasatospora sp. NPDC057015 TaxID=3346001 RepID=UPI00363905B6
MSSNTSPSDAPGPELTAFDLDLTVEEIRRRTEVMAALGPDWDPVAVLRGEEEAYALLYSGLDAEQQQIYSALVAAGVLPPPPGSGPDRAAP